jgi:formate dehydrogenase beta subunit
MAKVIFGAWDEKIFDNRGRNFFEIEEAQGFPDFDEFDAGNQIKAFMGGRGFFVFERGVDLIDAHLQYLERAAQESCGKCTPCRVGTQIICSKLEALARGKGSVADLDEIAAIAAHVRETSLCGLGQTATVPLLQNLTHFREELAREVREGRRHTRQPGMTYMTSACIEACPAKVDVPRYIDYLRDGKIVHSLGVILQKYPMAATCGRVCVRFCELACRRAQVDAPVGIKLLKRFVADHEQGLLDQLFSPELVAQKKPADLRVAVVGAGPAGISAAYHLLLAGYPVDVYEAHERPGGMAWSGIPSYRLPKEVLRNEVAIIERLGGRIFYGKRLGKDFGIKDLFADGYKAVFLGLGAHQGKKLRIPGEDPALEGYLPGVKLLLDVNRSLDEKTPMSLPGRVVVVGGGNVSMDCARSALRLGAGEVHLVYRRSKEDMPADPREVEAAEEEGVVFHFMASPSRIHSGNGRVKAIEFLAMRHTAPDGRGVRGVAPVEGSEWCLAADWLVPAIGQEVERDFLSPDDGIVFDKWGAIEANPVTLMTGRRGVFAGGDCVTGPATVIQAMAQGLKASRSIDDYLTYGRVRFFPRSRMRQLIRNIREMNQEAVETPVRHAYQVKIRELDPEVRKEIFEEVEKPISLDEAYHEASRCLRCYRIYSVITER